MVPQRSLTIIVLTLMVITALPLAGAFQAEPEPETETISESGYCSNPSSGNPVWEDTYDLSDVTVLSVQVRLTWTDDEASSEADTFEVSVMDDMGNSDAYSSPSASATVSMSGEGFGSLWTLTVECLVAGPTPRGLGIILPPIEDPGNSWSLAFTYTYLPADDGSDDNGLPPNIAALLDDPLFKLHVGFMILSTVMFGLVGAFAGIHIVRGRRWKDAPERFKRMLAGTRFYRALAVHTWLVFLIASVPLGMYVAGKAYGWENAWTSFPAVWNPWFYDLENADNVSFIVLLLWAIPLWLNREQVMAHRSHAFLFRHSKWARRQYEKAPLAKLTDREMAIIYFLMGIFVFLVFMVQSHGN